MLTEALVVPPAPVQLKLKVLVTIGETFWVPEGAKVPVHPPLAVQVVALVELQVKVAEVPLYIQGLLELRLTVGGGVLFTVTLTTVDVVVFPAASLATAVKVCAPSGTVVLFQTIEYGLEVSSALRLLPSSLN
jgi:hypothetical protein